MDHPHDSWYEHEDHLLEVLNDTAPVGDATDGIDIPGYTDLVLLFHGGQGVIYRGRQISRDRRVAIKVLRTDTFGPTATRRFDREIAILRRLEHPNVVRIHDTGVTGDGQQYLVMDFIDGLPLDEYVLGAGRDDTVRKSVIEVLRLVAQICDGVHAAHRIGVLHRDIKPANIRVDTYGQVHVLDFGLARETTNPETAAVTSVTGGFVGSLLWASPEQISADRPIDTRSDIYVIGVLLCYLLTGRLPYPSDRGVREVLEAIATGAAETPGRHRDVPDDVDRIARSCLYLDPDRRYESVAALATDLRRCIAGEPIEATREGAWQRAQATVRRYRRGFVGAIAAASVFLVVLLVITGFWRDARDARAEADADRISAQQAHAESRAAIQFITATLGALDPAGSTEPQSLRSALDYASSRLTRDLAGRPRAQAEVANVLAHAYYNLGALPEAQACAELVLQRLPVDDAGFERGDAGGLLARVHHSAGNFDAAAAAFAESQRALTRANRPDLVLRERIGAAEAIGAAGRATESRDLLVEILVDARALRRGDQTVGIAALALGAAHVFLHEFDLADPLLHEARTNLRATTGPDSLYSADACVALARLNLYQGDGAVAAELALEAQTIMTAHTGGVHPAVANCLLLRAEATWFGGGDPGDAPALADEAVAINRTVLGDDNLTVAQSLERCGQMYRLQRQYADALERYDEAMVIYDAKLVPDHPQRMRLLGHRAGVLVMTGRCDEATADLRTALAVLEPLFGPDARDVQLMTEWLAVCER